MGISASDVDLRPAGPGDGPLLARATLANLNWREPRFELEDVVRSPKFAHYLTDFANPGDFGVVADVDGQVAGVCWTVTLPSSDPGYGFVAADIPEVSLTVFEPFRRQGIGRALLAAVTAEAVRRGHGVLSLSVEDSNPARALYETAGFRLVGRCGDSDTMLLGSA